MRRAKTFVYALISCFALYSLFAFAMWQENPLYWDPAARVSCAFMMGVVLAVFIAKYIADEHFSD